jgi:hypothetical protein
MHNGLATLAKYVAYPSGIKAKLENARNRAVSEAGGLTSIGRTGPADVFVCGYPKSGNTWFQNLMTGLLYGCDMAITPDTIVQAAVPDVHYAKYYKRFQETMFFKSHHLPRPDYRRVVYLMRDGRDVMVSYLHYLRALKGHQNFLDLVTSSADLFPCHWHEHVTGWRANPYRADMIVVRYEDLLRDPVTELGRVCAFARIERSPDMIRAVSRGACFAKMRQKEIATGWNNPIWPRDKAFVRRGEAGSYRDEMPDVVLEAFMAKASATLAECGYDI